MITAEENPAFFAAYEAGHAFDTTGLEKLVSDHEDDSDSSQEEYRSALGLKYRRASVRTMLQPTGPSLS